AQEDIAEVRLPAVDRLDDAVRGAQRVDQAVNPRAVEQLDVDLCEGTVRGDLDALELIAEHRLVRHPADGETVRPHTEEIEQVGDTVGGDDLSVVDDDD